MAEDSTDPLIPPTAKATAAAADGLDTAVAAADTVNPPDASANAESGQTLPPLTEILHDTDHFEQFFSADGKKRVKCLWCSHDMPLHATKLLCHAARIKGKGVKICQAIVPKPHRDRYLNLYEKKLRGQNKKSGELFVLTHPFLC